jgi:hypothetical protein
MQAINSEVFLERGEQPQAGQTFLFQPMGGQGATLANPPEHTALHEQENEQQPDEQLDQMKTAFDGYIAE